MIMTRQSLIDRAWLRNQSGPAANVPYARYDALEPQARAIMAAQIAADPSERVRNQLKKDFALTVTLGVASLTASVTASEPMLDNTLDRAVITSADSDEAWQYLPSYPELTLDRPTFGMIYFTVKNGSLIAKDTNGDLGVLSTTATCSANYIPLAATFSGNLDLEEAAIRALANLAAMKPEEAQVAA